MDISRQDRSMLIIVVAALVLFPVMFRFQGIGWFDFWWWMSSNLVVILFLSTLLLRGHCRVLAGDFSRHLPSKLLLGLGSAVLLYLIFLLGNYLSGILIPGAAGSIDSIYHFKGNASALRILILMMLVIGPGEELFWRGVLQHHLMEKFGPYPGYLLATLLYALVHVLTGNFMLIMAALVAGIFWGWMYLRFRSIAANVVSHVVWDIAIFLVLPIT